MASLFDQARDLANKVKGGVQSAAQSYLNTYQKVAPYVPFAPQIPKAPAPNQQHPYVQAAQHVQSILRPPIQAIANTPVTKAIPFAGPTADLLQRAGVKQPTFGDVTSHLIYNPQTKQAFPQSPFHNQGNTIQATKDYYSGKTTKSQYTNAISKGALSLVMGMTGDIEPKAAAGQDVVRGLGTSTPSAKIPATSPTLLNVRDALSKISANKVPFDSETLKISPSDLKNFGNVVSDINSPPFVQQLHQLYTKVGEHVKPFDEALNSVKKAVGGESHISDVKTLNSLVSKVVRKRIQGKAGYSLSNIGDALRGTVVVKGEQDIPKALEEIQKQFPQSQVQNFFQAPNAYGYRGAHVDVELPNGIKAEIQVHTPQSIKAKDEIHKIYEQYRGQSEIPKEAYDKSQAIAKKYFPDEPVKHQFALNTVAQDKAGLANAQGIQAAAAPPVNKTVGDTLSHQEVMGGINDATPTIDKVVTREQTKQYEQAYLKTKQQFAQMTKEGKATPEAIDTFVNLQSAISDAARRLEIQKQTVGPAGASKVDEFLKKAYQVEKDVNKIKEAAQGVNFNDEKQAAEFYRKFVKPKASEWLDLLRNNSMLSSPNTHINNAFSNAGGSAVIAPIEKSVTGFVDYLGSKITGKQQTAFAGEGPAYAAGYFSKVHDAAHNFGQVMRGVSESGNLDTQNVPLATKGLKGVAYNVLSYPMRLLEASDQFFTTLTAGGEKAALQYKAGKGVAVGNIEKKAADNAAYRLYRSDLFRKGQGTTLDAVDHFTSAIQGLRNSSNPIVSTVSKFTVPFLKTPMNILKQGIEYSPAGIATLHGAEDKSAQLAKAIIGSSAMAGTAMLVTSGRTTWAEPTNPKEQAAFRAAGMQPYSIKIGNTWISYSKLPPQLSFPIAFVSSLHQAQEEKKLTQNDVDVILNTVAQYGNFFADQSYLKSIGDTLAAIKGTPGQLGKLISNYPQQLIPFRALSGWLARITDPVQRKVNPDASFLEQQTQQLLTQIPWLSQQVPARLDNEGNPIPNENRVTNAVSPLRMSTEKPQAKAGYDTLMKVRHIQADINASTDPQAKRIENLKNALKTGTPEERKAYILKALKDGSLKKEDITAYANQLKQKAQGFTPSDNELAGASSAVRAQYIKSQLDGKTPDEKRAILMDYAQKKILNKATLLELAKLHQK